MKLLRALLTDNRAATAAEFALVAPIACFFMLAIMDGGRYSWQLNQAEKAAMMGVRFAVVTSPVEGAFTTATYAGNTSCGAALTAGDPICRAALGKVTCTSTSCTCTTSPCPSTSYQSAAFTNILARIRLFAPFVQASNLRVEYTGSGLGYASDPDMAIAPIITVRLQSMPFTAISLFGMQLNLPTIARSQTMEDGKGTRSF